MSTKVSKYVPSHRNIVSLLQTLAALKPLDLILTREAHCMTAGVAKRDTSQSGPLQKPHTPCSADFEWSVPGADRDRLVAKLLRLRLVHNQSLYTLCGMLWLATPKAIALT